MNELDPVREIEEVLSLVKITLQSLLGKSIKHPYIYDEEKSNTLTILVAQTKILEYLLSQNKKIKP